MYLLPMHVYFIMAIWHNHNRNVAVAEFCCLVMVACSLAALLIRCARDAYCVCILCVCIITTSK